MLSLLFFLLLSSSEGGLLSSASRRIRASFSSSSSTLSLPSSCTLDELTSAFSSPIVSCKAEIPSSGCGKAPGIKENFKQGIVLGKGSFGTVTLAKDRQGRTRVVKGALVQRRKSDPNGKFWWRRAFSEIVANYYLPTVSEHFPTFHGAFLYENGICLVMEHLEANLQQVLQHSALYPSRDVSSFSGRLPEHLTRDVVRQLLQGLKEARGLGIELGDIKPNNIMINSSIENFVVNGGVVKFVDFGLAGFFHPLDIAGLLRLRQDVEVSSLFEDPASPYRLGGGTRGYFPPSFKSPGFKAFQRDPYALGVVMLQLSIGGTSFPLFRRRNSFTSLGVPTDTFTFCGVNQRGLFVDLSTTRSSSLPSFMLSPLAETFLMRLLDPMTAFSPEALLQDQWFAASSRELREGIEGRLVFVQTGECDDVYQKELRRRTIVRENLLPPVESPLDLGRPRASIGTLPSMASLSSIPEAEAQTEGEEVHSSACPSSMLPSDVGSDLNETKRKKTGMRARLRSLFSSRIVCGSKEI